MVGENKEKTLLDILNSFVGADDTLSSPTIHTDKMESLSRSASVSDNGQAVTSTPKETITKTVALDKLVKLYNIDGITYRAVQEYVYGILGSGFYFKAKNDKIKEDITKWANSRKIKLKSTFEKSILDILVYGGGNTWVEIVPNQAFNDIAKLVFINPATMDYIRDEKTGNVMLDEYAEVIGYVQTQNTVVNGAQTKIETKWYKDKIEKTESIVSLGKLINPTSNVIYRATKLNEDCRDRVAHWKLFGSGDSYLGSTPLEVAYKIALIRMNVEDTLGESAYRGGGLVAYIDQTLKKLGEEQKNRLIDDLKNITSRNIFLFDKAVTLDTMPIPDQKDRENIIYVLADEQTSAMGIPITLVMKTLARAFKGEKEEDEIQFELNLIRLQERFAECIKDSLLRVWCKYRGIPEEDIPDIKFIPRVPNLELNRARTVSSLARWNIITYDPELEITLREEMDLPTKFVKEKLKEWNKNKGKPIQVEGKEVEEEEEINPKDKDKIGKKERKDNM